MTYKKVKEICKPFSSSILINKTKGDDGNYPLWGAKGLVKNISSYQQAVPYISIVKWGAGVGRTEIRPSKTSIVATMQGILPNNNIDIEWLCSALEFLHLEKYATKATVPNLYFRDYGEALLQVPDYDRQKYISGVLKIIEKIVKKKEEELQKLDTLTKARFVEMFGSPGTDLFGYGKTKLGSCCEINPRKADDKRLVNNIKVSFVPMSSVSENGGIDASDIRTYDEVKKGFTYFAENDVLFAKITPCMENGKGAVAKSLMNGIGFGSTEFHVLRPIDNISNPYWIYIITSFKTFRKDAEANMTGSAGQRRTPASFLENYEVSIPPIELQNHFADFVSQVDKSKFVIQKSLEKTQMLFESTSQSITIMF